MATFLHPETGVELNHLEKLRKRLNEAEEHTVHLLRKSGHKVHDIAAMLGTNSGRVTEVLTGKRRRKR